MLSEFFAFFFFFFRFVFVINIRKCCVHVLVIAFPSNLEFNVPFLIRVILTLMIF